MNLLETESYSDVLANGRRRKRPKLITGVNDLSTLLASAEVRCRKINISVVAQHSLSAFLGLSTDLSVLSPLLPYFVRCVCQNLNRYWMSTRVLSLLWCDVVYQGGVLGACFLEFRASSRLVVCCRSIVPFTRLCAVGPLIWALSWSSCAYTTHHDVPTTVALPHDRGGATRTGRERETLTLPRRGRRGGSSGRSSLKRGRASASGRSSTR